MSMLSESRKRTKWTLNPRGTFWAKDENKFGQKMLEKMGWSSGKGLGANQQGSVDPISVQLKDDNKGIGFKSHDDTWISHQDDFASVLASLNEHHGDGNSKSNSNSDSGHQTGNSSGSDSEVDDQPVPTAEPVSLETKSKRIKKRVHYHKFTRGKDLSRYSSQDLDCILGSQAVKEKRKAKEADEQEAKDEGEDDHNADFAVVGFKANSDADKKDDDGCESRNPGFVTIKRGSMGDYFAKRMAEIKAKRDAQQDDAQPSVEQPQASEQADVDQTSGISTLNKGTLKDYFAAKMAAKPIDEKNEPSRTEKKKKRKKEAEESSQGAEEKQQQEKEAGKKKKKKKKSSKDIVEEAPPKEDVDSKKKKIKKKQAEVAESASLESSNNESNAPCNLVESRKKKKNSSKHVTEEPVKDNLDSKNKKKECDEAKDSTNTVSPSSKEDVKKKRKKSNETVEEAFGDNDEAVSKRKKKKKKQQGKAEDSNLGESQHPQCSVEEVKKKSSTVAVEEAPDDKEKADSKKKKNKRKREATKDKPRNDSAKKSIFDGSNLLQLPGYAVGLAPPKKKKKK